MRSWALRCFVEAAFTPQDLFAYEFAFRAGRSGNGARVARVAGLHPFRYELAIEFLVENSVLQREEAGKC